ncbi:DNA topoisomerase I [Candidatus Woesearchaeota archaeon]|nr:DNA topoisomerase I [Candidatus Woesearchaeota archaeon]
MTYELIITEKPSAAKKIAEALADGKPIKESSNGVPYYKVTHGDKDLVVACAVGHLYTVAEKEKKGWTYPVFDVDWKPTSDVQKGAEFSQKYITVMKKLAKEAKDFTVATDYDIEGEVIGLNIVKYICKRKDARRMKFSTLTREELRKAYEHASPHLDWGQANAGTTRHVLDFYWGINLSRALSNAIKTTGTFKVLSAGRVQGPALKIIVDKEREIQAFKPTPYWEIELHGILKKKDIIAKHKEDKFWDKKKAEAVHKRVQGKKAVVDAVEKKRFKQPAPTPFDLTTLQTEAYRSLGIQPKDSLAIAQELYLKGLISYPRTSSQKLPKELGLPKIMKDISKQKEYHDLCEQLLRKKELVPNEGSKIDPAHPAIFPTGQSAKIDGRQARVYDLIVRRFLATFAEPAVRETITITILVKSEPGEIFMAAGTHTIEPGWHVYYGRHVKFEEQEFPATEKGDEVTVKTIDLLAKETQPPRRYTPASIIKELEKRNLGTKATRAAIVEALYLRGYVHEKSIQATDLGIRTCAVLEKYSPKILDEELTQYFEEEMEEIREKKKTGDQITEKAKEKLIDILHDFKKKEKDIGKDLAQANQETRDELSYIGQCKKCGKGDLQVRRGKFGRFIACNKYPDCKTTFSLPAGGLVKSLRQECEECGFPLISIQQKGKAPTSLCINRDCKKKKQEEKDLGNLKKYEKPCPTCKEGTMVVRKSIYGMFLGCNKYPKCKTMERLNGNGQEKEKEKKAESKKEM